MVQKEVAERLVAKSGGKDYGIITIMLDFYGNVKIMRNVSRKMFTPMPNVDSSVVRIDIVKDKYSCNKEMFSKIVHAGFSMRRKTLVNNLSSALNLDKQFVAAWLQKCGIDLNARAESLQTVDYVNLTNAYFDINQQN
jgi:16S rRNA (adenine1518-N6/adenine1519-N6)-dimethyltransferase